MSNNKKRKINKIKNVDLTLQYLIDVGENTIQASVNYDMDRLRNTLPALHKLNNIIGMSKAKDMVAKIVNLYTTGICDKNIDMMHTMIQGDSGTGKTMLARILGEIYWKLGVLDNKESDHNVENKEKDDDHDDTVHRQLRKKHKIEYQKQLDQYDYSDEFMVKDDLDDTEFDDTESVSSTKETTYKFIEASRTDCIDRYQGGTAAKTAALVKSALGGVLFIDEAYSLGNSGAEDTYNKECIDTLTSLMEKYKGKVVIILAGYKHSMEETLLRYNKGLSRRITFNIIVDDYTPENLSSILKHMIINLDTGKTWQLMPSKKLIDDFFIKRYHDFPHFGGDVESFLFHIKINHSTRLLNSDASEKKKINMKDIENGFKDYDRNRQKE